MTHICVNSTARGAISLGYRPAVVAVTKATRALPGLTGETVAAADLQLSSRRLSRTDIGADPPRMLSRSLWFAQLLETRTRLDQRGHMKGTERRSLGISPRSAGGPSSSCPATPRYRGFDARWSLPARRRSEVLRARSFSSLVTIPCQRARLRVRICCELHASVRHAAGAAGTSRSEWVRQALEKATRRAG